MKIELKKIRTSEVASEETTFFKADLYCDGKHVGYAENDGHGGSTNYSGIEHHHSEDIKKMEAHCKTLPKVKYHDIEWEQSLEGVIDELVEAHLKEKENKKMLKKMEKGLLISMNPEFSYSIITWKNQTIESMLRNTVASSVLKKAIEKYRGQGYTIMNTNIPNEILN